MRWVTGFLAIVIATPVAAQQAEVTLQDAVRRALDIQPAMVSARGDQRLASAATRSAFGAYLPTVSTSASAARSNVGRIDINTGQPVPPEYSYTGSLNVSLELFDGFRRFANLKVAAANRDAAAAGFINQRYLVMLATKQVFYNALATEELVRVADAQVKRAQQQLQISVDKLHAGSATRSDSLRSTVEYGNARIALLQSQGALASAQASLGQQIGLNVPVRAIPDSTLPAMPDTADLRQTALRSAPAVQEAEATARAARAQVWSARSQYWPSLIVTYGNNRQGTSSPNFPLFSTYPETFSWRFGVSWTLFNGFTREANQVSASVNRDVLEARASNARSQVNALVTQQLAALSTAFEQMSIARDNLAAATEDLRVQNERYRVGAATILDLLTSQSALTQAQVNVVQVRFNYLITLAQVEATIGKTL